MSKLYDTLPVDTQLALAVRAKTPFRLAQTFALFAGQFYDRDAFDTLARRTSELYEADDPESAYRFRRTLDRQLHDRYDEPVSWDLESVTAAKAA